jgi:hypothetical protein
MDVSSLLSGGPRLSRGDPRFILFVLHQHKKKSTHDGELSFVGRTSTQSRRPRFILFVLHQRKKKRLSQKWQFFSFSPMGVEKSVN